MESDARLERSAPKTCPIRVEVRERDVPVTAELRELIHHRIAFALGRFAGQLHGITVRFLSVSGPRGGRCVCAQVEVRLLPAGRVRGYDTDSDPFVAATRAIAVAARSVARALDRERPWDGDVETIRYRP